VLEGMGGFVYSGDKSQIFKKYREKERQVMLTAEGNICTPQARGNYEPELGSSEAE